MFGLRKILGTIVLVVAFLALASLANFYYNANQEQQAEMTNNPLVQKGKNALGVLVGASESMADVNLQKNTGLGKTVADTALGVDWKKFVFGGEQNITKTKTENVPEVVEPAVASEVIDLTPVEKVKGDSFWTKLSATFKNEWENSSSQDSNLDYQKTASGAEIIVKPKSGGEYKVPLPLRFLNKF